MSFGFRILVVGPSWVGDMVMAQSLFMALRERHKDPCIDVLAPAWSFPLVERMPEVRAAIAMPLGHGEVGLRARWRLGRALRPRGYCQAIVLPNSLKSALVPFAARIPRRTGWLGEMRLGLLNDIRRLDRARYRTTVQRFVALAYPRGAPPPRAVPRPSLKVDPAASERALRDLGLEAGARPLLALCPGAEYGPAKRWPAGHYAALAAAMRGEGWDVWLLGSVKDRAVCDRVAAAGGCRDLCGRTSLSQAVDLMALADAVVSNDSGLMHVASALGRNLVALFGSSDPGFTPPLSPRARVLSLGLECSPCFARDCPLGHRRCLRDIPVERVRQALRDLVG